MKKLCSIICEMLASPVLVMGGILLISAFSLAAALTAELAFGLEPCILCIYQRIPYLAVIILAGLGLMVRGKTKIAAAMIGLSGLAFLANSAIAFYHTGVERKWWRSPFESCAADFGDAADSQSLLENILSAPSARCDEIPWADPLLGLSMANYNVALCFGLALVCFMAVFKQCRAGSSCP